MFKIRLTNCTFCILFVIFYLLAIGKVDAKECPTNEVYTDCGGSCQTECATLNEPCLIRHIRCPDGCYCNDGFARDASGSCIPIEKCPKKE